MVAGSILLTAALATGRPAPTCADLLPAERSQPTIKRALVARDLVRLRDIGEPTDRVDLQSPLGVSPDGKRVAFLVRRAAPERNAYCQGLVVVDLEGRTPPRLLDLGGDLIRERHIRTGLVAPKTGLPRIITPQWSPDGKWIARLKRTDDTIQAWIVRADGTGAHALTQASTDVEEIAWTSDGRHLVCATRPGLAVAEAEIAREGESGYLFDDRFRPVASNRPFPRGPIERQFLAVTLEGFTRPATDAERALIDPSADPARPPGAVRFAGRRGMRAWTKLDPARPYQFSSALLAETGGNIVPCAAAECSDQIVGLWRAPDGDGFLYLRRQGYALSLLALYRWRPAKNEAPVRLLTTEDLLIGCVVAGRRLLCLDEGSTRPRRLVAFDPAARRFDPLFDPNPEFAGLTLGKAQRLRWRNTFGFDTFGDLVLPPGHRPGQRHPLVIVQYTSRGFLRGGTGDEYPVQLLANRGFAVLSIQHPPSIGTTQAPQAGKSLDRINQEDWAWRRSVQSTIETGLSRVLAMGVADPGRIGITGLSDGATSVAWALVNSRLFAAAAVSSCCLDRSSLLMVGPRLRADFMADGYPSSFDARPDFWRTSSIAASADQIVTPLLMQLSDDEYTVAFETYYALKDRGHPVEMHVFPGERHIKWQSAHRLAIYERGVDWFDFWLNGHEDPAPAKAAQYVRWRALRERARPAQEDQDCAQLSVSASASNR